MTREEAIKSALKYLVHKQQEQGSWGYADNDNINKVPWDEVLEWINQQSCGDLISRQAVLDLAKSGRLVSNGNYKSVCDAINGLPPVEPERKPGKWINGKCNRCGKQAPFWAMSTTYYCSEYCPKCGAKMEVDG